MFEIDLENFHSGFDNDRGILILKRGSIYCLIQDFDLYHELNLRSSNWSIQCVQMPQYRRDSPIVKHSRWVYNHDLFLINAEIELSI